MNTVIKQEQNYAGQTPKGKIHTFKPMDKKQLKEALHRQIDELEDKMALEMLHEAATEYIKSNCDGEMDKLTPEQLQGLHEALEQLDNGQWKTHEEFLKLSRSWFMK